MIFLNMLITLLAELIRTVITYKTAKVFFSDDDMPAIRITAYSISFMITSVLYLSYNKPILNLCITFFCLLAVAYTYDADIKRRIGFAAIILSLSAALDTLAVYITGGMTENPLYGQVQSFISILLYLLAYLIYHRISRRQIKKSMSVYEWLSLIGILTVSIICLVILVFDAGVSSHTVIIVCFALLLNDIVVYYLFSRLSSRYQSERETLLLKEQMSRYEADLSAHMKQEDRIRLLQHDMKHHLLELKAMAEASKYDEIADYISEMPLQNIDPDSAINTGNRPVDTIMGYMLRQAEERGVRVIHHITVPQNTVFPVYDLTVILGNLMDNAIENAVKAEDPCVSVYIKYAMNCLLIDISNTYDGAVNEAGGKLLTTKADAASHGIGLSSVRTVVDKNHGELCIEYDKERFTVKVMLYV